MKGFYFISGVSTENTSLDRSPDTEQNKNIKENHFMQQNRVLKSPVDERIDEKDSKNTLESSFSDVTNDVVNISYVDGDVQKNEAGSSRIDNIDRYQHYRYQPTWLLVMKADPPTWLVLSQSILIL